MKKILLILFIAVLFLSSCDSRFVEFPFDEDFEDWSGLEPIISDFNGELFGDKNITVDGYFTGCEKLGIFGDMLHCNDDGSVIWFDRNNGSLYRLNYKEQKEKICPKEDCRNNIDGECNHMQIFNYIYCNGLLYFTYSGYDTVDIEVYKGFFQYETRQKIVSQGVFIYRYDIDKYKYEKLIEFQGITECEFALNGRYIYAQTYTWETSSVQNDPITKNPVRYKADFTITRIDLYQQNAVVVYSDLMNPDDFDKICDAKDFRFISDKIIMPVNEDVSKTGSINICNVDMQNIITLIEFENETIRDLYLYENDIYFISDKITGDGENYKIETRFCRVSIDMYEKYLKNTITNKKPQNDEEKFVLLDSKKREILNTNISSFCIDEDFLYYRLNGDSNLYRIKLDYSRELDFHNTFAVYVPKESEDFNFWDWKVCNGYLYATLFTEDGSENSAWRCRKKLNFENEPYLFYKE